MRGYQIEPALAELVSGVHDGNAGLAAGGVEGVDLLDHLCALLRIKILRQQIALLHAELYDDHVFCVQKIVKCGRYRKTPAFHGHADKLCCDRGLGHCRISFRYSGDTVSVSPISMGRTIGVSSYFVNTFVSWLTLFLNPYRGIILDFVLSACLFFNIYYNVIAFLIFVL